MSWTEGDYLAAIARMSIPQPGQSIIATPDEPESVLQAKVRQVALAAGWLYYHTHDSRKSDTGFPDTVLCRPGELVFLELKAARKKPSQAQAVWLSLLATVPGVEASWQRPADWPALALRLTRPAGESRGGVPSTEQD